MSRFAVLFDMDGLLVDSEPTWSVAEEELMRRLGSVWNADVKAACIGHRVDEACRRMVEIAGGGDPAEAMEWLLARMVVLFREDLPLRPGAMELLEALRDADVPMALVSSSYRVLVDAALDQLGRHWFAVTLSGDEVRNPKPHPEPYLTAARRLGVDPDACVVLEDSFTGVTSAEEAGCVCVVVPNLVTVPAAPHRPVLTSLAEATPAWLAGLVTERLTKA